VIIAARFVVAALPRRIAPRQQLPARIATSRTSRRATLLLL